MRKNLRTQKFQWVDKFAVKDGKGQSNKYLTVINTSHRLTFLADIYHLQLPFIVGRIISLSILQKYWYMYKDLLFSKKRAACICTGIYKYVYILRKALHLANKAEHR